MAIRKTVVISQEWLDGRLVAEKREVQQQEEKAETEVVVKGFVKKSVKRRSRR